MGIDIFGPDRNDIQAIKFPKLKMKKDEQIRAGIVNLDEEGKKFFIGAHVHVKKGGPLFFCLSTKDKKEICCSHPWEGRTTRYRVGCILVKYDLETTKDGKIKLRGYELVPWLFWETMFQKLSTADREFPIAKHDIKLICTNTDYQTIDIHSCKDSIWTSSKELRAKILEESKPLVEKMKDNIAVNMTINEIKELLGLDTEKVLTTDLDISKLVSNI